VFNLSDVQLRIFCATTVTIHIYYRAAEYARIVARRKYWGKTCLRHLHTWLRNNI